APRSASAADPESGATTSNGLARPWRAGSSRRSTASNRSTPGWDATCGTRSAPVPPAPTNPSSPSTGASDPRPRREIGAIWLCQMHIWRLLGDHEPRRCPMTTTIDTTDAPAVDEERIGAFIGRLIESCVAAGELVTVDLGRNLGLYAALTAQPKTAPELAAATGIHARYAREWLEQQAVAGILEVDGDGDGD